MNRNEVLNLAINGIIRDSVEGVFSQASIDSAVYGFGCLRFNNETGLPEPVKAIDIIKGVQSGQIIPFAGDNKNEQE